MAPAKKRSKSKSKKHLNSYQRSQNKQKRKSGRLSARMFYDEHGGDALGKKILKGEVVSKLILNASTGIKVRKTLAIRQGPRGQMVPYWKK
jgi:hypothetical protein